MIAKYNYSIPNSSKSLVDLVYFKKRKFPNNIQALGDQVNEFLYCQTLSSKLNQLRIKCTCICKSRNHIKVIMRFNPNNIGC